MEQMGFVGLGKLRFMLFVDEWGASECRCGYYRALASFHMALSPSKYPVTFILSPPFSEFSQYPSAWE